MNEEQLAEIEQRLAKATPGPWGVALNDFDTPQIKQEKHKCSCEYHSPRIATVPNITNAHAISNAPTDIANLLAEVRRLNRMVDVSCKALSDHGIGCPLCIYSLQWDCDAECEVAKNEETCWRKYLEEAAGNG